MDIFDRLQNLAERVKKEEASTSKLAFKLLYLRTQSQDLRAKLNVLRSEVGCLRGDPVPHPTRVA